MVGILSKITHEMDDSSQQTFKQIDDEIKKLRDQRKEIDAVLILLESKRIDEELAEFESKTFEEQAEFVESKECRAMYLRSFVKHGSKGFKHGIKHKLYAEFVLENADGFTDDDIIGIIQPKMFQYCFIRYCLVEGCLGIVGMIYPSVYLVLAMLGTGVGFVALFKLLVRKRLAEIRSSGNYQM